MLCHRSEVHCSGFNPFTSGADTALADAVNRLLADESLRERMGAAGRARVEEKFTRENMAGATLALFREMENGK
jgi:glycosyltransferase involved in cell wall biosynthesis